MKKAKKKNTKKKIDMGREFQLKDSGHRQTFDSGAQRDRQVGKGRYDLISPFALHRLALIAENGAIKYEDRNWEKGMPITRFIDSAKRHLNQALAGKIDEDHLAQAMWNCHAAIHILEMIRRGKLDKKLDDRPDWGE